MCLNVVCLFGHMFCRGTRVGRRNHCGLKSCTPLQWLISVLRSKLSPGSAKSSDTQVSFCIFLSLSFFSPFSFEFFNFKLFWKSQCSAKPNYFPFSSFSKLGFIVVHFVILQLDPVIEFTKCYHQFLVFKCFFFITIIMYILKFTYVNTLFIFPTKTWKNYFQPSF